MLRRFLKTVSDDADVTFCGVQTVPQQGSSDRKSSIADGRWSKGTYVGQQAMMTKQS